MADGVTLAQAQQMPSLLLSLEGAVEALEAGQFPSDTELTVQVRDNLLTFSPDAVVTGAAHRRLAGLLLVMNTLQNGKMSFEALQRRKPVLHADVAQILDALRSNV